MPCSFAWCHWPLVKLLSIMMSPVVLLSCKKSKLNSIVIYFSSYYFLKVAILVTNSLSSLLYGAVSRYRLRCFIHRLISPMHRTDVGIDASNFQPMNGIKQHFGECYNVKFVLLINFNFQQRNFITLKNLILIYLLYVGISYDCCSDNRRLAEYIVAIGNSSVHRSSTPIESMDSPMNLTTQPLHQPMNLTTVWCKSDASVKSTGE